MILRNECAVLKRCIITASMGNHDGGALMPRSMMPDTHQPVQPKDRRTLFFACKCRGSTLHRSHLHHSLPTLSKQWNSCESVLRLWRTMYGWWSIAHSDRCMTNVPPIVPGCHVSIHWTKHGRRYLLVVPPEIDAATMTRPLFRCHRPSMPRHTPP